MENAANYTRRILKGGAKAHKSLGQNFLMDDRVIEAIAAASIKDPEIPVVEIGPGLGVLTRVLAQKAQKVWAVELDRGKVNLLQRELQGLPVDILNMDALKLDLKDIWGTGKGVLVGNLPYYITSPLLMHFLEQKDSLASMVVMVQKEVADRLVAKPGGKDYGILSIAAQVSAQGEKLFEVPPQAFWPAPKVTSAVVRFELRSYPGFRVKEKDFFRVVKAAFSQRRKTLGNSLAGGLGLPKQQIGEILAAAGVDEQRRAETLSIDEFQAVTEAVMKNLD
ncbi:16S rRNA (adenine(1518)-N(6)/adenine(1519)-N(6))-dimethyltransferase RsmA [Desulfitobacterium hafniense]|uniref:Ribosomal RNA small subunit methyltransferase A n=5 Tax=root TaxID=1 RepID=RSMA_DESHY|nr:16S rRNA (adenine(1518)-N(6)/adenine(1519)-N(6))-dimethyltransferase RsmA [Desulfitobacterium hafniense]B8FY38.1 RecName: Full=Ribosomal RNA small subunit methyltransferase A; AltName: Full=16S rRNA (adenine(1518)-N(6)/adenine(1519)-N(6))-dimethyltransferase; AltName: Full=16S rRNA dimethyladenosine transferase; AltName: Full=16S rRNA dimethylase; AltName: Full=S-adenosylmethionine-6-N', N'-adenosyl(rRNA) dimethyltransferase [Desulfitobacterium hafniense DCB-2]Q251W8.1 RecName: Full=Ribosomal 